MYAHFISNRSIHEFTGIFFKCIFACYCTFRSLKLIIRKCYAIKSNTKGVSVQFSEIEGKAKVFACTRCQYGRTLRTTGITSWLHIYSYVCSCVHTDFKMSFKSRQVVFPFAKLLYVSTSIWITYNIFIKNHRLLSRHKTFIVPYYWFLWLLCYGCRNLFKILYIIYYTYFYIAGFRGYLE